MTPVNSLYKKDPGTAYGAGNQIALPCGVITRSHDVLGLKMQVLEVTSRILDASLVDWKGFSARYSLPVSINAARPLQWC